ncbi:M48 family metallopeptidase [Photobacterium sp. J15]|uniref:M48 family metallopeptidase n=1 Tax=Photobacterium sp. J15 TaxID=265901 RepID=UPI000A04BBDF|nr:M48 family metallopeptidase [Photobacterium sp. J15]
MIIRGICHPPYSSAKLDAELEVLPEGLLKVITEQGVYEQLMADVEISEPLGNLPLKLTFSDGRQFIPHDSGALKAVFRSRQRLGWLHRIERNFPAVIGSLVAMALVCVLFFTHGMPWLTGALVTVMPDKVSEVVGEHVLTSLDEHLFELSELSPERQAVIRARFTSMTEQLPPTPIAPKLVFRRWELGPNALALSDGSIIVFDSLVDLAQTQEQLDSILLHELGHIEHQHVMKSLVRSALLSAAVAVLTGESTGLIDTLSGAGVFLATQGYSRSDEQEADQYAANYMKQLYGSVEPMQQMFGLFKSLDEIGEQPEWLSTHPELDARIEALAQ